MQACMQAALQTCWPHLKLQHRRWGGWFCSSTESRAAWERQGVPDRPLRHENKCACELEEGGMSELAHSLYPNCRQNSGAVNYEWKWEGSNGGKQLKFKDLLSPASSSHTHVEVSRTYCSLFVSPHTGTEKPQLQFYHSVVFFSLFFFYRALNIGLALHVHDSTQKRNLISFFKRFSHILDLASLCVRADIVK